MAQEHPVDHQEQNRAAFQVYARGKVPARGRESFRLTNLSLKNHQTEGVHRCANHGSRCQVAPLEQSLLEFRSVDPEHRFPAIRSDLANTA